MPNIRMLPKPAFSLLLAALLLAPLSASSFGSGVGFAALEAQTADAVVAIETQSGRGSGFLVDRAGRVVTACHVVNAGVRTVQQDGRARRVVDVLFEGDPRTYLATVENACQPLGAPERGGALAAAARDDVAVLQIIGHEEDGALRPLSSPTGFARLWLADAPPALTEPVFVAGFGGPFAEASFLRGSFGGTLPLVTATVEQIRTGPGLVFGNVVPRDGSGNPFSGDVGLVVTDLLEGGPAARAGVRPGDVVIQLDGEGFSLAEAGQFLATLGLGDVLRLTVARGDGTFRAEVAATRVAFSRAVRFVDRIWCFPQEAEALTQADFNSAGTLDLTNARHTLAAAADLAENCAGTALVTAFGSSNGNGPSFAFAGRVTEVADDAFEFEELSTQALQPFEGELVSLGRGGTLAESSFHKVTALSGPGFSGGPVLNASGQVVGFVDFGLGDPAPGYLVTAEVIRDHLDALDRP